MDSDLNSPLKEINGINLANYIPQKRSYNSVEYIHKRYFDTLKQNEEKEKIKSKKVKKTKQDKGQQFSTDKVDYRDNPYKFISNNDTSVLEQTIKFAKNLVPLVIPPSEDKSQVFYTIKSSKKQRTKGKKSHESNFDHHAPRHEREEPKKVVETYRKVKKESISVKESISHSDNTLDDLNINQSLCCTFSEVSEKKCHKKEKNHSKKNQKITVSESFEAVATEAAHGDAKIKIHLMNDKEKHFLSESIKEPVLNALKECLSDLNNYNINSDITTVQKIVKCNSEKLDNILHKLACIESKLESHEKKLDIQGKKIDTYEKKLNTREMNLDTQETKLDSQRKKLENQERVLDSLEKRLDNYDKEFNTYMKKSTSDEKKVSQVQDSKPKAKASTLENLGADLIEMEEEGFSSEEELHQELLDRRSKTTVVVEMEEEKGDKKLENLGGGEVPRSVKGTTAISGKLERPNRPSRFCWTDAARQN